MGRKTSCDRKFSILLTLVVGVLISFASTNTQKTIVTEQLDISNVVNIVSDFESDLPDTFLPSNTTEINAIGYVRILIFTSSLLLVVFLFNVQARAPPGNL
ncbi:hypothetical protein [Thalassotalea mangrovi]|uniref:Uncharacterized protein n=1 Tax=Thalassotalea mangrovi TaxID=2572245 RepID=A0A4U1B681_9GAMM|nr:hypothetical protein [Thalassotalea mangrovi]TKB45926.1 hypothetical protein E8M12_06675 [Thalassotalea mangrovi]